MRISDVLRVKGDNVVTVPPETDVRRLLEVLAEHRIGAVVVSADGRSVAGIVSERDIVRALAARGAAVLTEQVTAIHTPDVRTVSPDASLADADAAGLVPEVLFATWDLRPFTDGADFLVASLRGRDR